ncbi:MAG TPA: PepSY domain-containing protein [Chthoniobacterales bacterium]
MTAANLEKVDGKLVWSIEIAGGGGKRMTHVTIDAMSGRIVAASRAHR